MLVLLSTTTHKCVDTLIRQTVLSAYAICLTPPHRLAIEALESWDCESKEISSVRDVYGMYMKFPEEARAHVEKRLADHKRNPHRRSLLQERNSVTLPVHWIWEGRGGYLQVREGRWAMWWMCYAVFRVIFQRLVFCGGDDYFTACDWGYWRIRIKHSGQLSSRGKPQGSYCRSGKSVVV